VSDQVLSAPCALYTFPDGHPEQAVHCDGRVYSTERAHPLLDGSGRWEAVAVCDTCQAEYKSWFDADGENATMYVTTGRARGLPEEFISFTEFGDTEEDA
jgi:hypothetical protein